MRCLQQVFAAYSFAQRSICGGFLLDCPSALVICWDVMSSVRIASSDVGSNTRRSKFRSCKCCRPKSQMSKDSERIDPSHGSASFGAEDNRVTYTGAKGSGAPPRSASAHSRQTVGSRPASGTKSRPASGRPARPFSGVSSKSSSPASAWSQALSARSTAVYSGEEDLEQLRQRYTLLGA